MVTDTEGKTETVEAMSYKKMLKKLKPLTSYKIEYKNKKNHHLMINKSEDLIIKE